MHYTEETGETLMWLERGAVYGGLVVSSSALVGGIAEYAGLIDTAVQGNNIIKIINKTGKWGYRINKPEPGKGIHQHFWT